MNVPVDRRQSNREIDATITQAAVEKLKPHEVMLEKIPSRNQCTGGDFVTVHTTQGGREILVMGDFNGHGTDAAQRLAGEDPAIIDRDAEVDEMLKRVEAQQPGHYTAAAYCEAMDRALSDAEAHLEATVVEISPPDHGRERTVQFYCLGSQIVLLYNATSGTVETIKPAHGAGPQNWLGMENPKKESVTRSCRSGDRLLISSDGLSKADGALVTALSDALQQGDAKRVQEIARTWETKRHGASQRCTDLDDVTVMYMQVV